MQTQLDYVERFMMHTELYMVLTGKAAADLTGDDMMKIGDHIDIQQRLERDERSLPPGQQVS